MKKQTQKRNRKICPN